MDRLQVFHHRTTAVWIALAGLTLLAWALSAETLLDSEAGRLVSSIGILVVAFTKVRFIGLDFMELRHAPLALRRVFDAWTGTVCTLLVVLLVVGG